MLGETDGRGADYAFDAVGLESTLTDALAALRPGGEAVVIGHAEARIEPKFDTLHFLRHKRVTGTFGGSIDRMSTFRASSRCMKAASSISRA